MANYQEIVSHLLSAAYLLSPTGKEQRGFARLVDELARDTELSDDGKLRRIVGAIYDGLAFGNWPKPRG